VRSFPRSLSSLVSRLPGDRLRARLRDSYRRRPEPFLAALLASVAGVAVFLVATSVFEFHSSNHDEAVYLQQAAMLLEGQLELFAGDLAGAFRPWFFVADGGRLYPKYAPVPAAMYAVPMALFGEPRVTLAAVAAGNTFLVYLLASMVADRPVGLVAAALYAASPLALVTSATFLPYAPTTFLNLAFAVAYVRGIREESLPAAALAGVAIGLAAFARPFTALLFALPFVAHAGYRTVVALRDGGLRPLQSPVVRHTVTALGGLAFVGVTLAYNARLTGSPLTFPFEAFAPLDGPGFGRRHILSHAITYTPEVALRANGYVLRYLTTRWVVAGPVGTLLAAAGIGTVLRRWMRRRRTGGAWTPRDDAALVLAGLFVTIPLGNLFFWGNYNVLGTPSDPTDGLVSQFGPIYHFDLLVPVSVFAAVGLVAGWRWLAPRLSGSPGSSTLGSPSRLALLGVLASLLVLGALTAPLVATPLERNAAHTEKYEAAYEPIEATTFENDLVFLPTPYGDWQNHPFQYLRNDPGFDGPVVYALDRGPAENFAVLDAYPHRRYHRYTYRGEWSPDPGQHVRPKLEGLDVRGGESVTGETVVGVPPRVDRARVRLSTGTDGHVEYTVDDPADEVAVSWSLTGDRARLDAVPGESVRVGETDRVVLRVTLVQPDGSTLTYRQEADVRTTGGVEVVWPPERTVCPLTTDCGTEGTYLPDDPDAHRDGVFFRTRLRVQ